MHLNIRVILKVIYFFIFFIFSMHLVSQKKSRKIYFVEKNLQHFGNVTNACALRSFLVLYILYRILY